MKSWPWGVFSWSAALLAGCDSTPLHLPVAPIDASAPTLTETATFALG